MGGAWTAAKPPVVELTSAKTAFDLSADLSASVFRRCVSGAGCSHDTGVNTVEGAAQCDGIGNEEATS